MLLMLVLLIKTSLKTLKSLVRLRNKERQMVMVITSNILHEKILHSDWLRQMQFTGKKSAEET